MYRELNQEEQKWLKKLLDVNFLGKRVLEKQIKHAKIIQNYNSGFISLKFKIGKNVEKFPYNYRVPAQMIANQSDGIPIIFLIHVINGYIDELEIFNAGGHEISENINIDDVKIIIEKELIVND